VGGGDRRALQGGRRRRVAVHDGGFRRALGEAVQADPVKPNLKPPRSKRLKPRCVLPLSNCAFNFNLRRYISGEEGSLLMAEADLLSR